MLPCLLRLLPVALLLLLSTARAQQSDTVLANSLLWRIEGKGMQAASYLYGTCHVEDARAFRFSDSVLPALRSCSTVATELRLDSLMWQIFTRLSSVDSSFDLKAQLNEEEYSGLEELFSNRLGLTLDNYRHADPFVIRLMLDWLREGNSGEDAEDEEPSTLDNSRTRASTFFLSPGTFLDAWLSRYGKLQEKQVVGLETYEEQINATDSLTIAERIRQLLVGYSEQEEGGREAFGNLLDAYAASNLHELEQIRLELEQHSPAYHHTLLVVRNHTMARRMAELMERGTLFTAVGALHLPGPSGLIALLRRAGYTVTPVLPVYSSRYPRLPSLPPTRLVWDSGSISRNQVKTRFVVPTPMFASPFKTEEKDVQVSMAIDIETGLTYMVVVSTIAPEAMLTGRDSLLLPVLQRVVDGKTFSTQSCYVGNVPGIEVAGTSEEGKLIRARAVVRGKDLYLLEVQGGTSMLSSRDPDRFFSSFRFGWNPDAARKNPLQVAPGTWVQMNNNRLHDHYADTSFWFSSTSSRRYSKRFHLTESPSGTLYTVSVVDLPANELPLPDTALAADLLQNDLEEDNASLQWRRAPASDAKFRYANEGSATASPAGPYLRRRVLIGEGRALVLTTISSTPEPPQNEVRAFFDSLQVVPPTPLSNREVHLAEANCRVEFPTVPERTFDPASEYYSISAWHNVDRFVAESWSQRRARRVVALHTSPYLRVESIDSTINNDRYGMVRNDSVWSERIVESEGIRWHEYLILPASRSTSDGAATPGTGARHVRFGVYGNTVYVLTFLSLDGPDSTGAERFFGSFGLIDPTPKDDLLASKTDKLLTDLTSADTTVWKEAISATQWYRFRTDDLPRVYEAFRTEYPDDTDGTGSRALAWLVWSVFADTNDAQSVAELYNLHTRLPVGNTIHGTIATALARIGTPGALDTLLLLLPTDSGHVRYASEIASTLVYNHSSIGSLYPAFARYVDSAGWEDYALWLTAVGLDSGQITLDQLAPEVDRVRTAASEQLAPTPRPSNDEFLKSGSSGAVGSEVWNSSPWAAKLLGDLPLTEQSERALRRGLDSEVDHVARACAVSLLRHNKEVDRERLAEIAENPVERVRLYTSLQHFDLLRHFPRNLATQEKIGEGMIAAWLYEEEEGGEADVIEHSAVRVVQFNGNTVRAHLYRYRLDEDGEWFPALVLQPESSQAVDVDYSLLKVNGVSIHGESPDELVETLLKQKN